MLHRINEKSMPTVDAKKRPNSLIFPQHIWDSNAQILWTKRATCQAVTFGSSEVLLIVVAITYA